MRKAVLSVLLLLMASAPGISAAENPMLGLPQVPIPEDNPQTPEKINLGDKLFHDQRFSMTGEVSCSTCHLTEKAFTDSPLKVSEGIRNLTGTRNAPTVINSAYFHKLFLDGRVADLEEQSLNPLINPVEHGLKNHDPVLEIVRTDPEYVEAFKAVFGKTGEQVTMREVSLAIASFERTIVGGNSPFDRWYYGGESKAMSPEAVRGFNVFIGQGRCVSCHVIEQTQAIFTDNRFHNIGAGINRIQEDVPALAGAFLKAKAEGMDVDVAVLTDAKTSELGRFAITDQLEDLGSFKTPTLRNVALTAPYMHDGSLETLKDVMVHYNNGGVTDEGDKVNDYLSGGIRPLDLTDSQLDDLVAFMEALTSPQYAQPAAVASK